MYFAKSRFKYAVRRLKRRHHFILREKLAKSFARKRKDDFWSEVKRLNKSPCSSYAPVVDGNNDCKDIAALFASNFSNLLNRHSSLPRTSLFSSVQSSLTESDLTKLNFSEDDVLEALSQMKPNKCDSSGVFSEHSKYASTVIAEPLALFLSSVVRHGYMPKSLRDCTLIYLFPRATKIPLVVTTIVPSHCHPTLVSSLKGLFC